MNAVSKAIPGPAGAGCNRASAGPCLTWEIIFVRTLLGLWPRKAAAGSSASSSMASMPICSSSFWMRWLKPFPKKKACANYSFWTTLPGTKPPGSTGIISNQSFTELLAGLQPHRRLWLRLKADWFWDFFARTHEEPTNRFCAALKSFMDLPAKTASICSIRK
jgi:hypothetical protein